MKPYQDIYEEECENIKQERDTYKGNQNKIAVKFIDVLSAGFFFSGFIALILIPFTEVSLLHATCLFVIHYTVAPTDLDRGELTLKGIAEDLGNIRANISVIRKRGRHED